MLLLFALVFTLASQLLGAVLIFVTVSYKIQFHIQNAKLESIERLLFLYITKSFIIPHFALLCTSVPLQHPQYILPWSVLPTSIKECIYLQSSNVRALLMLNIYDACPAFGTHSEMWRFSKVKMINQRK